MVITFGDMEIRVWHRSNKVTKVMVWSPRTNNLSMFVPMATATLNSLSLNQVTW